MARAGLVARWVRVFRARLPSAFRRHTA